MARKPDPTDLTDKQWERIAPYIPPEQPGGRHREVDMREVVNGILYVVRGGGSWRMLPHDLPPWGTVHYYYRRFRRDGTWQRIHDALRERVREQAGKQKTPSAAVIDAQSVQTAGKRGMRAASTRGRRSKAASGIWWSTRSD